MMRKFRFKLTSLLSSALLFAAAAAALTGDCLATALRFLIDEPLSEDLSFESAVRDDVWTPPRSVEEATPAMPSVDDAFRHSTGVHQEIADAAASGSSTASPTPLLG